MYLVAWWDADENDDKIVPFKSKQDAEKYYSNVVAWGGTHAFLCKVLKEHHNDEDV